MTPWVVGGPYNADLKLGNLNNVCSPDNLFPLADGVVLIGEDSDWHKNNNVWVVKPCAGAECTAAPVIYTNPAEEPVVVVKDYTDRKSVV